MHVGPQLLWPGIDTTTLDAGAGCLPFLCSAINSSTCVKRHVPKACTEICIIILETLALIPTTHQEREVRQRTSNA